MILRNKGQGPGGLENSFRSTLGGFLGKNLVSCVGDILLGCPAPESLETLALYSAQSIPAPFATNYTSCTYPSYPIDSPLTSNNPESPRRNSSGTNCHSECVSLQNSKLTSEFVLDNVFDNYFSHLKPIPKSAETISYNVNVEENIADYEHPGYHPVLISDEFTSDLSRYRVLRKLGWGHSSSVWLCFSLISGQFVALKIVKLESKYTEAALEEIKIVKMLQEDARGCPVGNIPVVRLLDHFAIEGPNGTHIAMAFELMGENLLHLIFREKLERFKALSANQKISPFLLPIESVKLIVYQLLEATDFMHRRSVIHTDLKPENILLTHNGELPAEIIPTKVPSTFQILPSQPLRGASSTEGSLEIKVADLGNATFSSLHWGDYIQTRQYRAPEILLDHIWGALADVWSIGCIIFELLTGDYLFEPKSGTCFSKDEDHMAQIIELLGSFPAPDGCRRYREYFQNATTMKNIPQLKFWPLECVLEEKYKFDMQQDDIRLACDLMLKCLRYDLNERYDCGSIKAHPFFRKNAKFDQQECDKLPNNNITVPGFTCEGLGGNF